MPRKRVRILRLGSAGNVGSLIRALTHVGASVDAVPDVESLEGADAIVLPGVGSFADASGRFASKKAELAKILASRPTLGICLGMQILADVGNEFGRSEGLGLIAGSVRRMAVTQPLPHFGWRSMRRHSASPLFEGVDPAAEFYFMHSFELDTTNSVIGSSTYGGHEFVSAVQRDRIFGVQFHPERSREPGLRLLRNFVGMAA